MDSKRANNLPLGARFRQVMLTRVGPPKENISGKTFCPPWHVLIYLICFYDILKLEIRRWTWFWVGYLAWIEKLFEAKILFGVALEWGLEHNCEKYKL